jgi:ribosomal protein L11 methyltransferase
MNYISVNFKINNQTDLYREIIIAELGEAGYEGFRETDEGLEAYINKSDYDENILKSLSIYDYCRREDLSYTIVEIKEKNWNAVWEQNFEPIIINDQCIIKAPFHQVNQSYPFEIIIEPKMSFGTGHHETTYLMIEIILEENLKGKKVLDMGCGTGVLGILASMKGAYKVTAIDIDEWAYNNAIENAERNRIKNINILKGDSSLLGSENYDTIFANINRNILLKDMETYVRVLVLGGKLIISGILPADEQLMNKIGEKYNLKYRKTRLKNNWIAMEFRQKSSNFKDQQSS